MTKNITADSGGRGNAPDEREALLRLSVEALKQLGRASAAEPEGARALLDLIRARTGIEAAALRLREGEDYPYLAASGFPEKFLHDENFLCARAGSGKLLRSPDGKVLLACVCGKVLRGKLPSELKCNQAEDSFCTGSTTKLRESHPKSGEPEGLRHRCNDEGYESVALLPLKAGNRTIGLLQLNDKRKDFYSPELIAFFEEFSSALGEHIAREQSEKRKEQAGKTEAVRRLAGGMAHDFNNILGAVRGYAEFLRGDLPVDSPGHGDVEEILTAADRAAAVTRQLLALSGSQPLSPETLDLNKTAGGIAEMLGRVMGGGRKLELKLEPVPCMVKADGAQLKQVITSLVVNALSAGSAEGPVTVGTELFPPAHKFFAERPGLDLGLLACLTVSVSGVLSDEVKNRLFEPFFTIKEREKASEVGLAVALGIVRQSGGALEVESKPGRGTVFRLYLPYTDEVPEKAPAAARVPAAPAAGVNTVLIVDDDAALLKVAARILRKAGYTVLTAPAGHEALELLSKQGAPVDLLITDVAMPGMSGSELALQVSRGNLAGRILYISGHADQEIAGQPLNSEPSRAFICKPFTHEDFLRKARAVLDGPPEAAKA